MNSVAIGIGRIDRHIITCPICDGNGRYYYAKMLPNDVRVRVTPSTYMLLPRNREEAERKNNRYYRDTIKVCECCGGSGKVEEYDY